MKESTYSGDDVYSINCTGDCVVGDEVAFERAVFSGSFRNAKFERFELVQGKIVRDSYGADKGQHTFTLHLAVTIGGVGELRIKGRNLYRNGTWRKPWFEEALRKAALNEKHERGDRARSARRVEQF